MVRQRDILKIPYADIGVDHDIIAVSLDEKVFGIHDRATGYNDADDFLVRQHDRQMLLHKDTVERLRVISGVLSGEDEQYSEWQSFFSGAITAMAVLDEIATVRGVNSTDYRAFWLGMKCTKSPGVIDFVIDVDDEVIESASAHYQLFATKIADETTSDDLKHADFVGAFGLTMATGKMAMAKHLLSVAAIKTSQDTKNVDFDSELQLIDITASLQEYNTDATQDFQWLQHIYDTFFKQKEITAKSAEDFTDMVMARITQPNVSTNLHPNENIAVKVVNSGNIVLYPNVNAAEAEGPDLDAETVYLDQDVSVEGKFVQVAMLARFPSPHVLPETLDVNKDVIFGPAIVLSHVRLVTQSGDINTLNENLLVLAPVCRSDISIWYDL